MKMKIKIKMIKASVRRGFVCVGMTMFLAAGCGQQEEALTPGAVVGNMAEEENPEADSGEEDLPREDSRREENQAGAAEDSGTEGRSGSRQEEKDSARQSEKDSQDGKESPVEGNAGQSEEKDSAPPQENSQTEEINGSVRSVDKSSFVISKATTYSTDDGDIAVMAAPGSGAEELVTVLVTDTCVYQYMTVKNSGINPEDISARGGSFADLREGLTVIIKGRWQDGVFVADNIKMEEFI